MNTLELTYILTWGSQCACKAHALDPNKVHISMFYTASLECGCGVCVAFSLMHTVSCYMLGGCIHVILIIQTMLICLYNFSETSNVKRLWIWLNLVSFQISVKTQSIQSSMLTYIRT